MRRPMTKPKVPTHSLYTFFPHPFNALFLSLKAIYGSFHLAIDIDIDIHIADSLLLIHLLDSR